MYFLPFSDMLLKVSSILWQKSLGSKKIFLTLRSHWQPPQSLKLYYYSGHFRLSLILLKFSQLLPTSQSPTSFLSFGIVSPKAATTSQVSVTITHNFQVRKSVLLPVCVCLFAQSCLTLCNPMDLAHPGSSVHGIFQRRTLEWVTISSSRESFWPGDRTQGLVSSSIGRWILYHCATWEVHISYLLLYNKFPEVFISLAKQKVSHIVSEGQESRAA